MARRAVKEAKEAPQQLAPEKPRIEPKKFVKIGRPSYRVTKQKDPENGQQSLLFQVDYPKIAEGVQPRHRMSAYEQKIEPPDRRWQYLLFAAEPYETIAFKFPSREVEKHDSKFWTHWNKDTKQFFLQLAFKMEPLRLPPAPPKIWENHGSRLPPPLMMMTAQMMGVPPPPPLLPVPPPPPSM
ncbi:splicing factor 3A subunit 2-like [Bicyclus anynana]|uniref:Splicing factor 3A subunit 2-like n=1 Tax=Bicyclus anynana TaxID=110368 RepID=A0ABM3LKI1_BICAN|nr:splicing factor 3A subunit 2-like [Bicyclus anynana]